MTTDATVEDTDALSKLKVLLRGWERAKLDDFSALETDIAVLRERVRELEATSRYTYARKLAAQTGNDAAASSS